MRVTDTDFVMLAFYSNHGLLDSVSNKIAGPWFGENVRSYLAAPVNRVVGEVILDV